MVTGRGVGRAAAVRGNWDPIERNAPQQIARALIRNSAARKIDRVAGEIGHHFDDVWILDLSAVFAGAGLSWPRIS